jgi:hypothetical protein
MINGRSTHDNVRDTHVMVMEFDNLNEMAEIP